MTKKKISKKKLIAGMPEVYSGNVSLGKTYLTIQLPLDVAGYLGITKNSKDVCWAGINGGIQITKDPTTLAIPAITGPDEFPKEA